MTNPQHTTENGVLGTSLKELFFLSSFNCGAEALQVFYKVGISAVDVEDIVDGGGLIRTQCRKYKTRTRTDIGTPHVSRRESFFTADYYMAVSYTHLTLPTKRIV